MICVDGALYLAVQNLLGKQPPAHRVDSQHGSDASIVCSRDRGITWTPALIDGVPMFPGHRFGGPAFVNFGKNNAGARDEFVYAASGDQWDNGTNLRLGRVPAGEILRREAWQWVGGFQGDAPVWTANLDDAVPVLSASGALGLPDLVYLAGIERYLLLTWRLHADFSPDHGTDLFLYEAPEPWGPFTLVYREDFWEGLAATPYCPRLPLKWLAPDGVTGWLQCSGAWRDSGMTPYYRSHIRPFRLKLR